VNSHLKEFSILFRQEGTTRDDRYPRTLDPAYVAVEGRQLKDLLLYLQHYAAHLRYIPSGEQAEDDLRPAPATWKDYLQMDIALLLADIAAFPVQETAARYDALLQDFYKAPGPARFNHLLSHCFIPFEILDGWFDRAMRARTDSQLKKDLRFYIASYLSRQLAALRQIWSHAKGILEGEEMRGIPDRLLSATSDLWGGPDVLERSYVQHVFTGKDDKEKLINASLRLKDIFDTACHIVRQVVDNSGAYLEESLHEKRDHEPHIALLITFLELYGYARDEINKLPEKHLRFYYEQILGIGRRKAVPDSVIVHFGLEKGFDACELKKGTVLSAGKDALNKEMIYQIDRDLVVRKAQAKALRSLCIARGRHDQVVDYYTDSRDLAVDGNIPGPSFRPLGDRNGASGARLGFAIASGQLYLSRGERKVLLEFHLEKDVPLDHFEPDVFELLLTGEKGWLSSRTDDDCIRLNRVSRTAAKTLELDISIPISQPSAIIGFDKKIHTGAFDTSLPILQCLLHYPVRPRNEDDEQAMTAYNSRLVQLNTFQKIRSVNTSITVQAGTLETGVHFDGVKDLVVLNHEGNLDPKKPFLPFTSIPKVGSSFYIGCNDLSYKQAQELILNLEWMLPDHFRTYYDRYMPPYDTNKFRATLSILRDKQWHKINELSIIDVDALDPRWRSIDVDTRPGASDVQDNDDRTARFDVSKKNGTLKLKLQYPDFGHGIYPQLITSSIMEKASSKEPPPNYYKLIKEELDNDVAVKLPADTDDRNGTFRVVIYQLLESSDPDATIRRMMIKGLSGLLRYFNDGYARPDDDPAAARQPEIRPEDQRRSVNDNSWRQRIMRVFGLISSTSPDDKDKKSMDDVADDIRKTILPRAHALLPRKKEVSDIADDVRDSVIDSTVVSVVDRIMPLRGEGVSGATVAKILEEEFSEANKVINNMIARKIAAMLMADDVPPMPYTPVVNMISVSYLSSRTCNDEDDRMYRIGPFGHRSISLYEPLFDETTMRQPAGLLFIGIGDWAPDQDLSLLFLFEEGTGNSAKTPPDLTWKYLANEEWYDLPHKYISFDTTYGLQTTGVIQFTLPPNATTDTALFDMPGLHWIYASVPGDADAFPNLVSVASNAVLACFKDQDNDPHHAALPLPAGRITRLVDKLPAIRMVRQPTASFHGRIEEVEKEYFMRVSERLRHRRRALCAWDYERLVLDKFPGLFKVKCLNGYFDGVSIPGHVTIVPVCDMRNRGDAGVDPLIPLAGNNLLREMEAFLMTLCPPHVKVHAINPHLSHILIRARVKFKKGVDMGYALRKLDKELVTMLTPWMTDEGKPSFSMKIYVSTVITFMDKRAYVEYVEGVEMLQYSEDKDGNKTFCRARNQDIALVETQFINDHTLLVSAPSHELTPIE